MRRALGCALALLGAGCVDPLVLPPPPGADTAAGVIYKTSDRLVVDRDPTQELILPSGPLTAFVYPRAPNIAALPSGLLRPPAARPCPLPEADDTFAWEPGDASWALRPDAPRVGGWFDAEPGEPVRLALDTTCGEGNDNWVATQEGCAIELRTRSERLGVQRAGLGKNRDGDTTLELFTPDSFGRTCEPSPSRGPGLPGLRCDDDGRRCHFDLLPTRALRTTSVALGPPEGEATTDLDLRLVPPFRFAYTGPAVSPPHVWVGVGDPARTRIPGCASGAALQRFDPDTLAAVGPQVPVPDLECIADLIPAPGGAVYVVGRLPPSGPECPVNRNPQQAWALVRVDAEGRAGAPQRLGYECRRVALRSEVDPEGRVLIGLANRTSRDIPGEGVAFLLDVDDGALAAPLEVTKLDTDRGDTELAHLQPIAPGRWMMLGRGNDRFAVLGVDTSTPTPTLRLERFSLVPRLPGNTPATRGFAYLADLDRMLAWPSGDASAAMLLWSAEPVATEPRLTIVTTSRTRRDIFAGVRWPLDAASPTIALLEFSQEFDRAVSLVPMEVVLPESRVRVAFDPVVVGQGAYHPTVAVDPQSRLFVTLTWAGRLVRVDPPSL
jgi:hypothetical protein